MIKTLTFSALILLTAFPARAANTEEGRPARRAPEIGVHLKMVWFESQLGREFEEAVARMQEKQELTESDLDDLHVMAVLALGELQNAERSIDRANADDVRRLADAVVEFNQAFSEHLGRSRSLGENLQSRMTAMAEALTADTRVPEDVDSIPVRTDGEIPPTPVTSTLAPASPLSPTSISEPAPPLESAAPHPVQKADDIPEVAAFFSKPWVALTITAVTIGLPTWVGYGTGDWIAGATLFGAISFIIFGLLGMEAFEKWKRRRFPSIKPGGPFWIRIAGASSLLAGFVPFFTALGYALHGFTKGSSALTFGGVLIGAGAAILLPNFFRPLPDPKNKEYAFVAMVALFAAFFAGVAMAGPLIEGAIDSNALILAVGMLVFSFFMAGVQSDTFKNLLSQRAGPRKLWTFVQLALAVGGILAIPLLGGSWNPLAAVLTGFGLIVLGSVAPALAGWIAAGWRRLNQMLRSGSLPMPALLAAFAAGGIALLLLGSGPALAAGAQSGLASMNPLVVLLLVWLGTTAVGLLMWAVSRR